METVIESYLNDFCDHFGIKDLDDSTKFEDFVNYVWIKNRKFVHFYSLTFFSTDISL